MPIFSRQFINANLFQPQRLRCAWESMGVMGE
jgi:hypothetical protein